MTESLENRILEIWKGVVRVDDVSTTDPFLSQGASSLNFVQFSSALQKQLDLDVEPEDVFRHGTVERLAAHLQESPAG